MVVAARAARKTEVYMLGTVVTALEVYVRVLVLGLELENCMVVSESSGWKGRQGN